MQNEGEVEHCAPIVSQSVLMYVACIPKKTFGLISKHKLELYFIITILQKE